MLNANMTFSSTAKYITLGLVFQNERTNKGWFLTLSKLFEKKNIVNGLLSLICIKFQNFPKLTELLACLFHSFDVDNHRYLHSLFEMIYGCDVS